MKNVVYWQCAELKKRESDGFEQVRTNLREGRTALDDLLKITQAKSLYNVVDEVKLNYPRDHQVSVIAAILKSNYQIKVFSRNDDL